jgi:hypothetical protein
MGAMEDGWKRIVRMLQDYKTPIGQTGFDEEQTTICANANEWYPVTGTFTNGLVENVGFDTMENMFTCLTSGKITFGGSGNFKVNKTCKITIGLFINNENLTKANTVIEFESNTRSKPGSRTIATQMQTGDKIQLKVKSTIANTNITIEQLNALFIGIQG